MTANETFMQFLCYHYSKKSGQTSHLLSFSWWRYHVSLKLNLMDIILRIKLPRASLITILISMQYSLNNPWRYCPGTETTMSFHWFEYCLSIAWEVYEYCSCSVRPPSEYSGHTQWILAWILAGRTTGVSKSSSYPRNKEVISQPDQCNEFDACHEKTDLKVWFLVTLVKWGKWLSQSVNTCLSGQATNM